MIKLLIWCLCQEILKRIAIFLNFIDRKKIIHRYFTYYDYILQIKDVRFICSKSLINNLDIFSKSQKSSSINYAFLESIPEELLKFNKNNVPTIYLCTNEIEYFSQKILKKINKDFILVTGDSDLSITDNLICTNILNNKYLQKWFAQNLDLINKKISSIPIGLDYHSRWQNPNIWGGGAVLPSTQEAELMATVAQSKKWSDRKELIYCSWHHNINRGDRITCYNNIDKSICLFEEKYISRLDSWRRQVEFKFIVSPEGEGIDCHRTWEAILLGCVPIIKKSKNVSVFDELPVIIVENWTDVTEYNLQKFIDKIKENKYDFNRIRMSYWIKIIKNKSDINTKINLIDIDKYVETIYDF
jgi:hypothetical protein